MQRSGHSSPGQGTTRPQVAPPRGHTDLLPMPWEKYTGTGMNPDMQVLWDRARSKGQVR